MLVYFNIIWIALELIVLYNGNTQYYHEVELVKTWIPLPIDILSTPSKNQKCVYPFDNFLTDFDRIKYAECLEKTVIMMERDSSTIEEATAFYLSKYSRNNKIPTHFEKWFEFARSNRCRINRYDGLHSQLEPFKSGQFTTQQLMDLVKMFDNSQLTKFRSKKGKTVIDINSERAAAYAPVFKRFEELLPDFNFVINTHAQPVIFHNKRFSRFKKTKVKFNQYPHGLGNVELTIDSTRKSKVKVKRFTDIVESSCELDDYRTSLLQGYGLFINPPGEFQTTKLIPMLSWGSYPGCTKDILVPSVFHYDIFKFASITKYREWKHKKSMLIWRGTTSGSPFYYKEFSYYLPNHVCVSDCNNKQIKIMEHGNYSQKVWFWSQRQRAATYAKDYPTLMSVGLVDAVEMHDDFKQDVFKFHDKANRMIFSRFFDYKFILDIDGNGYSSRFPRLLRGNSLVFSAHYATDWFSDIAIPFYHFIPVHMGYTNVNISHIPMDFQERLKTKKNSWSRFSFENKNRRDSINTPIGYNDLAPKILYYQENDALSKKIAEQGQGFADKYLKESDMDCYLYRVIIELYEILDKVQE